MQFEIDILPRSRISYAFSRNANLKRGLAVIARLPGKRLAVIDDTNKYKPTSMALYLGFSVPVRAEKEAVPREEIGEIVLKAWSGKQTLQSFILERDLIAELDGVRGVPQIVARGEIGMQIHDPVNGRIDRDAPFFIMPKIPGRDLIDFQLPVWDHLPERGELARLVTEVLPELAERLAAVHEGRIVHRDIKPNNIMFDPSSGAVTLLDFGRANWLDASAREDFGEFGFYRPEIILNRPEAEDVRYDTYGLGATGFMLISGMKWLLFDGIEDPGENWWLRPDATPHEVMKRYYQGIRERDFLSVADLVARSNMPSALKGTELSKFLIRLFHPQREMRPADMHQIAGEFRRLGGQLLVHELYSPA